MSSEVNWLAQSHTATSHSPDLTGTLLGPGEAAMDTESGTILPSLPCREAWPRG